MNGFSVFEGNPLRFQSHIMLAFIIHKCFPKANLEVSEVAKNHVFDFYYQEEHLIQIDQQAITRMDAKQRLSYSGIIEGSIQNVADSILRGIAERDIEVLRPPRDVSDINLKELKVYRTRIKNMKMNKCPSCKVTGFIRKIYVGPRDDKKFDTNNYFHAGEKRGRDTGWYICLSCNWRGDKF